MQPHGEIILANLKKSVEILKLHALRAPQRDLCVRFAQDGNSIFIDCGDEIRSMIEVNSRGWRVMPQQTPLFLRPTHQRPLAPPTVNGNDNFVKLFDFINLPNEQDQFLLGTWFLSAMLPNVSSPILLVVGPQGAGKTTICRWIRSVIDPSVVPTLGLNNTNAHHVFLHHAVPCFENVSYFDRSTADQFCRAVTGNGVERRKLYTDCNSVIYAYRRAIIINGLVIPSLRPDFLDRCLVLKCSRFEKFGSLKELDQQFASAAGDILGGLLDLMVKTLQLRDTTPPATEFRMADFATLGRALATGLGHPYEYFDTAYSNNILQINQDIAEGNLVARLLRDFVRSHPLEKPWIGPLEELDSSLRATAKRLNIKLDRASYPGSPRWLSTKLSELSTVLRDVGVNVHQLKRTNTSRPWKISQLDCNGTVDLSLINQHLQGETND